jgi:CelD/BcsL family acetyltransferase involved in cellulose biosynthesis
VTEPLLIGVAPVGDFAALGARWRDLEARADASFFQSWSWTGCLVEERFPDPVAVIARRGGRVVGLALFNRRRRWFGRTRLYLGETGDTALDAIFTEHNGFLLDRDEPAATINAMLHGLAQAGFCRVVLGGVDQITCLAAHAASARLRLRASRPSWEAAVGQGFLGRRGANTRQQINRSKRAYAEAGALGLERAEDVDTALAWFNAMAAPHQARWRARGREGAFANPFFARFHTTLITNSFPRGEIEMRRLTLDDATIGYLYNFRHADRLLSYQSGFDYADPDKRRHPGLTAHALAIEAAGRGVAWYDFLAGDAQYKRVLADRHRALFWVEATPRARA